MKKNMLLFLALISACYGLITLPSGCAQISAPTGGARDSLPPTLVKASPEMNTTNFTGNKVSLSFNEYIDLQELQSNLIISPIQKNNPVVSYNLKTVNIKFKDTLLPNTTYTVDFGSAIRDVHEGNILKDFTYVFSTGNSIDSLTLEGKVILAETGKIDSTIIVMLYRNLDDSAVLKTKPDYIAKLDGKGNFKFNHLSGNDFKIYALKDGDGGKTYNAKTEIFAFADSAVSPLRKRTIQLFAYAEQKADNKITSVLKTPADKKLRYTTNQSDQTYDYLQPYELNFNNPLKLVDSSRIILTDTSHNPVSVSLVTDSTRKKIIIKAAWQPSTMYLLAIPKEAIADSAGNQLSKTDTIRINTKGTTDYGSLLLRFTNIDLAKNPVVQFIQNDLVKSSFPVTKTEWSNKQFPPGEYTVRILYDLNRNGLWDPGNYTKKIQPEKAITLEQPLSIRADWENERDIRL